tara:strand:+ start:817 stop:1080 length:264 start_codon:yes stop_codon:yes gene_type:complete
MNTNNTDEKLEKDDVDWLNDAKKSREIVSEILRFGVTQSQMKNIISLLALELEDRDMMIAIRNYIEPNDEEGSKQNSILYPGGSDNE